MGTVTSGGESRGIFCGYFCKPVTDRLLYRTKWTAISALFCSFVSNMMDFVIQCCFHGVCVSVERCLHKRNLDTYLESRLRTDSPSTSDNDYIAACCGRDHLNATLLVRNVF